VQKTLTAGKKIGTNGVVVKSLSKLLNTMTFLYIMSKACVNKFYRGLKLKWKFNETYFTG